MAWSLLNGTLADRVTALVDDAGKHYGPDVPRAMDRDVALAVIHAALWAYSSRVNGTAGVYAMSNLFDALKLSGWTFQDPTPPPGAPDA